MLQAKLRARCQYFRRRAGYTQKDLANQLFVTPSALSKWESGATAWPPGSLARYEELLDLNETERQELVALIQEVQSALYLPEHNMGGAKGVAPLPKQEPIPLLLRFSLDSSVVRLGILLVLMIVIAATIWLRPQPRQPPVWEETFDPIQQHWRQDSATWEELTGPEARLKEDNPAADFGKVESAAIRLDVDVYPILRIEVGSIDPQASYTIQILDKRTGIPRDVLKGVTVPGSTTVNLMQELGWHGGQEFTINVWISGESKSATFRRLSIETSEQ